MTDPASHAAPPPPSPEVEAAYAQSQVSPWSLKEKIGRALTQAGTGFENVIRTRIYVTDMSRWEEVGRAHGEVFRNIRPASTLVGVASLVRADLLVEIEATALVHGDVGGGEDES